MWTSSPIGTLQGIQSVEPGSPVAVLQEGEVPLTGVQAQFNPQSYYSHITGLRTALLGNDGEQYTVKNSRIEGILRPFIFTADDTEEGNLQKAVENKAGLMFGNTVNYSLSLASWRDPNGQLWKANTTVKVTSPRAYISSPYEFLVKGVTLARDSNQEVAELRLVLPGSYSGKVPETLPWD
jgi:prophage tail gpP-like protein